VILAAFAEGSLPEAERVRVERHAATCPECPAVIGATVRYLAEASSSDDGRSYYGSRRWIAAAAVSLCIAAAAWRIVVARDALGRLRSISAAQSVRPVEGHLHRFAHAPFAAPRSDEKPLVDVRLRHEAQRLARKDDSAAVLHARGVAALLTGETTQAVQWLAAAAGATEDAAVWNDLAVAQLARAGLGDRTAAQSALRAADRALELSPESAAAHFNRAVALVHLDRPAEAATSFRNALARERSDSWRDDIRERLEKLSTPS
jgi:tetratricopeptide (TPR) repeat protein